MSEIHFMIISGEEALECWARREAEYLVGRFVVLEGNMKDFTFDGKREINSSSVYDIMVSDGIWAGFRALREPNWLVNNHFIRLFRRFEELEIELRK